jgi:hypothetical protein
VSSISKVATVISIAHGGILCYCQGENLASTFSIPMNAGLLASEICSLASPLFLTELTSVNSIPLNTLVFSSKTVTLQKNSQEISVTCSAIARPQPIRQGNFREIKTSVNM